MGGNIIKEGKCYWVLEVRNQYENATTQRVWMVIELYRLEGHHFVSLSLKEMRECDKAKGVYTVLEARRQCENEIRQRG